MDLVVDRACLHLRRRRAHMIGGATSVAWMLLSCARPAPPHANHTPTATNVVVPQAAIPSPPAPTPVPVVPAAPARRPSTLTPSFELALALPWGTAGFADPLTPQSGRRSDGRRRSPTLAALRDGTLWFQTELFSAVLVRHGSARRLPFTGAGLEWYLGSAPLAEGVLLLGRTSNAPSLARLDAGGSLLGRRDLPESDAGPPLNAYSLLQDDVTGAIYLWSAYEHQLRRVSPRGVPIEPAVSVAVPASGVSW
ncbi:MAG: hypothetical protein WCJ30_15340, partial [Deltaproteobacteria bacterium]